MIRSDRSDDVISLGRAGLAGEIEGSTDRRPPLVLLHGLTFDHRIWRPALDELRQIDPGRRVLALDLPGHGDSPVQPSYDLQSVTDAVHQAVEQAGLVSPIVVGHSIGGVIATVYAARYPARGVTNVDQSLQLTPFVELLHALRDQILGPGLPVVCERFLASMQIELLPPSAQQLIRSSWLGRQDLIRAYWREALDRSAAELAELMTSALATLRDAELPYLIVSGSEPEGGYREWLRQELPQATLTVWPQSSHFPHLAYPDRFAERLRTTASLINQV